MLVTEERAEILEKALFMVQHSEQEKWSLQTESEGGDLRREPCSTVFSAFSALIFCFNLVCKHLRTHICAPTPVRIPAQCPIPERYGTFHIHFTFLRG
jgi:hypothetical protein